MTYLDYLNDFNQWLETNALPVSSQLMYFKLLNVFNRAGWPEDVGVDNLRLRQMIGNAAEKTAIQARDKLVEAGFITYQKGRKGQPNKYSLSHKHCKIYSINYSVSVSENTSENVSETVSINASHIKTKIKTKTYDDDDTRTREAADEGLGRVMTEYMERIEPTPSPTSMSLLTHYVEALGPEVCLRAIYRAIDSGVRKWTYIKSILQSCERDGIKCLADWDRKEDERNARKPNSTDSSGISGADKRWHIKSTTL